MGVKISTLGIVVTGQVTRKHDAETNTTTLEVSLSQAQEINTATATVLDFFGSQDVEDVSAGPPTEDPNQLTIMQAIDKANDKAAASTAETKK